MSEPRRVYFFGDGKADGDSSMTALLGGKGANLAEMTRLGIPVPAGFTITTEACLDYEAGDGTLGAPLIANIHDALRALEASAGARFGDAADPLLVSVRSGARQSMPGMMDTVLNVGLNDDTVVGLAKQTDDARFAYDSYRRFIQMFGAVVLGVNHFYFEEELIAIKAKAGVRNDDQLSADALHDLVAAYKRTIAQRSRGIDFPQAPEAQLHAAVSAVFASWHNDRAYAYRNKHGIPHNWGTAVSVQAMVFGNRGDTSATGVMFTRNPSTGEPAHFGEYLLNAQGEDVVAGIRTPNRIVDPKGGPGLRDALPEAFDALTDIANRLETHYREIQDVEFTIERGQVWILQTRAAKLSAAASVRAAVDMARANIITEDEALLRVSTGAIEELLHPQLDPNAPRTVIATGLAASPGAATGEIVLSTEDAIAAAQAGRDAILVRAETTPEDIRGMLAAVGILTAHGGVTSHAAVVARQVGKCCVAGCASVQPDVERGVVTIGGREYAAGAIITLDGARGQVIEGEVPSIPAAPTAEFETLLQWADARRRIGVRTNVDNGTDAALARRLGAEGIGLVRTEHMFFAEERISAMQETILADDGPSRRTALARLRPFQRRDFEDLLEAMDGLPVMIRLLDPPLHEFLPKRASDIHHIAESMGKTPDQVRVLVSHLYETNPMLGHRGCRLGITRPEIYAMQCRAIFDATLALHARGLQPQPQIMIPLVSLATELEAVRRTIDQVRAEYDDRDGVLAAIPIGTMIELPRACAAAGELALHADFFSFGTNDLTQTVFGFSRDDTSMFLPGYLDAGLLKDDPFVVLDTEGVGHFIRLACARARAVKPEISIGICGEHGGEPRSVAWIQRGSVDYVSCSPFRVPVARLAAAQAAVRS